MLYVLAYNSDSESIVHGFIEKITVELNDIWVVLSLKKLNSFLLVLVEFVQRLGLHLFESIELATVPVDDFVNLGVLLARAKQIHFFEIFFSKHLNYY